MASADIPYQRANFSTKIRVDRLYTAGHYWLRKEAGDLWRVGFTRFAIRMLGEAVEMGFEVAADAAVESGQVVGWIEGFKAVSDVYCAASGVFGEINPAAVENPEVICRDPYGDGWIYSIDGEPDPQAVEVDGYAEHLNRTIDKMLEKPWKSGAVNRP